MKYDKGNLPMKTIHMVSVSIFLLAVGGCAENKNNLPFNLTNPGFEIPFEHNQPPSGWQTVLKDGYFLRPDEGLKEGSLALLLDGEETGEAVVVSQKMHFNEPMSMRFKLSGHLKTQQLTGESSMYVRAYADGEMIYQDDMRAYALSGDNDWTRLAINAPWLAEISVLEIGVLALGTGQVWFDEVELQSSSNQDISSAALNYGQQAIDLIGEHGYYSVKETDRANFLESMKGAQTAEDVYGSIVMLLSQLGDEHASFVPARLVDQVFEKQEDAVSQTGVDDLPTSRSKLEKVGYIKIPGFNKKTGDVQEYINSAYQIYLDEYQSVECGWVIDLTGNTGGSMWPMLAALSPFFDEEIMAYMRTSPEEKIGWQINNRQVLLGEEVKQNIPFDLNQLKQTIFSGEHTRNLAVLIDGQTASSAEAVAIALKSREKTLFFGQQSAGLTTGISQLELNDGSVVNLSMAAFVDHEGNDYPEGIMPDVELKRWDAFDSAYRFLLDQDNCLQQSKAVGEKDE